MNHTTHNPLKQSRIFHAHTHTPASILPNPFCHRKSANQAGKLPAVIDTLLTCVCIPHLREI